MISALRYASSSARPQIVSGGGVMGYTFGSNQIVVKTKPRDEMVSENWQYQRRLP